MGIFGFGGKKDVEPGLIVSYDVIYKGGLPDYSDGQSGKLELKVFEDRFEFLPTIATKKWFGGLKLPYGVVTQVELVERTVGTAESLLAGRNAQNLRQRNNIHFHHRGPDGRGLVLRTEMLSGVTVMGQAGKCNEFEDKLRTRGILDKFAKVEAPAAATAEVDVAAQLEKLAGLRDKGVISAADFEAKKLDLLARM